LTIGSCFRKGLYKALIPDLVPGKELIYQQWEMENLYGPIPVSHLIETIDSAIMNITYLKGSPKDKQIKVDREELGLPSDFYEDDTPAPPSYDDYDQDGPNDFW
jgi:hypothetical protein